MLSGNLAQSATKNAYGGGAYVLIGSLVAKRSTIRDNTVAASAQIAAAAGVSVNGNDAQVYASTISGNVAEYEAGLLVRFNATISNSTISGNSASSIVGGVFAGGLLVLDNSTVVLNQHSSSLDDAGIYAKGGFVAHSSIVANNLCATSGQHCEFVCKGCSITGANNLIMAAGVPAGTIIVDPQLGPLAANGGPTKTHAPLPGSPTLENGSNIHDFPFDSAASRAAPAPRRTSARSSRSRIRSSPTISTRTSVRARATGTLVAVARARRGPTAYRGAAQRSAAGVAENAWRQSL